MFYEEEFEDGLEGEEMAPEEESFPVDNGINQTLNRANSLGELKQKSGNGSQNDVNKLKDTLSKNQAKNSSQSIANSKNGNKKDQDGDDENEENPEEESNPESKLDKAAKEGASEVAKKAASTYMQAHGIPAAAADKIASEVVDSDVGQKVLDEAIKKFKDARKKIILNIAGMILPYVIGIFVVILIASSIMASYAVIVDKVEGAVIKVSTGIEKVINFASGNGWQTEEEEFFKTLEDQLEYSLLYSDTGIDIPLLAATIHYNNLIDVGVYEDGQEMESTAGIGNNQEPGSMFDNFIASEQTKKFYYVANDKLGGLKTFKIGHRRLIGHMVDIQISWGKYSFLEVLSVWKEFFDFFDITLTETFQSSILSFNIYSIIQEIKTNVAYDELDNGDSRYKYYFRNFEYELKELTDLIEFSSAGKSNDTTDEFGFWAPSVNLVYDEEKYFKYLVDVYVPGTFFSDGKGSTEDYERVAREIFQQRDTYDHLLEGSKTSIQGSLDNEIKISVKDCNGVTMEVVPLYEYISGVLYAEGGVYNNKEYLKAQAVASKSYLYAKNGASAGSMPRTLSIYSCSTDQLYCSIEKGCHYKVDGTLASGAASDGTYHLEPLSTTHKATIKEVMDETYEVFVVDGDDRIAITNSCVGDSCTGETNVMDKATAITLANGGSNYRDILTNFYSGTLKNIELNKYSFPLESMYNVISSRYGYRNHPISNCCQVHLGTDLPAVKGSNIYSYSNGVVTTVGNDVSGYGYYLIIGHGEKTNGYYEYYTLYAHQDRMPIVYKDSNVSAGQLIGYVGTTGMSTGPHLHFEMFRYENGTKINMDPYPYLEPLGIDYGTSEPAFSSLNGCLNAGHNSCG